MFLWLYITSVSSSTSFCRHHLSTDILPWKTRSYKRYMDCLWSQYCLYKWDFMITTLYPCFLSITTKIRKWIPCSQIVTAGESHPFILFMFLIFGSTLNLDHQNSVNAWLQEIPDCRESRSIYMVLQEHDHYTKAVHLHLPMKYSSADFNLTQSHFPIFVAITDWFNVQSKSNNSDFNYNLSQAKQIKC
jgi:hypothetical protein